jgi:putative ABC transport system permease protein
MSWIQDLRFGLRWMARSPGFTFAVVLTLALGIGANVALFAVVNAVVLRPLPYPEPDRLVRIWSTNPERGIDQANVNPLDFADWQADAEAFEALGGFNPRRLSLTGSEGQPELHRGLRVTSGYFRALGVDAALGRTFTAEETRPGGPKVAILSHALWRDRYGADPAIVGSSTVIDDEAYTIVGVLPPGFVSPAIAQAEQPALWVPLVIEPGMGRGGLWLGAIGMLANGRSIEVAGQEMSSLAGELWSDFPQTNDGRGVALQALKESIVGETRPMLVLLLSTVALLLLIACTNVTNLFLARSTARRGELSVRLALGASQRRLVRQLVTESLLFALLGCALGLGLGHLIIRVLTSLRFLELPRIEELDLDATVLLFTLGLSVLAGFLFGSAPILRSGRNGFANALRSGGRSTETALGRTPRLLVVAEVALALVLLFGAGLLLRSFSKLLDVELGFDPEGLVILETELAESRYPEPARAALFYDQLLGRIEALPGVESATMIDILPFGGSFNCSSFGLEDGSLPPDELSCAEYRNVGPGYFETMGIRMLLGDGFLPEHGADAPPVAVVNQALARQVWPGGGAVGESLTLHLEDQESHRIVGVVDDVLHFGLADDPSPVIYISSVQHPSYFMTVVARSREEPASLIGQMRGVVRDLDATLPVIRATELSTLVADSAAEERLRTLLVTAFAALAMALAAVGVFAVVGFSVSRRTHEIGLRMALGADRAAVLGQILRESMIAAFAGIALGIVAALLTARFLRGFLFEVSAFDPAALAGSAALLALVALGATLLPAYRASTLDPRAALQEA